MVVVVGSWYGQGRPLGGQNLRECANVWRDLKMGGCGRGKGSSRAKTGKPFSLSPLGTLERVNSGDCIGDSRACKSGAFTQIG